MTTMQAKPWYKQFWPWFIIAIPASSVIVGTVMIVLAMQDPGGLVREDWYKEGMAINQRLDKQNKAKAAGIKAYFSFSTAENVISLRVDNIDPQQESTLTLELVHPTQAQHDQTVQLYRTPQNTYFAKLEQTPSGFYYVQLRSEPGQWEIDSRINFNNPLSDVELAN
ncbi:MAG TPA: FixH family protein [Dongiaceae bacterium]|nr:FixH family protein [Dongiaceae bacterium]